MYAAIEKKNALKSIIRRHINAFCLQDGITLFFQSQHLRTGEPIEMIKNHIL